MIRRRRAVTGLLLLAIHLLVLASCFPVVVVVGVGSAAAEATEARAAEDGSCALNDSDSAENVNNDNINNGSKGDTKQQQQQDGETTATTDTTADTSTPPQVSHATLILENKEQVTVELTDDIMQRIHETLRVNGVLGGDNQALIQQLAMEEVHKWHQEQEQAQRSREQLLEQRRLQKQQQQEEESKPVFPYKLTLPPPPSWKNGKFYYNLDFVKDWTPQGGGRYAEYASGTSPYSNVSSQEQQNYSDEIARLRRPYIQQAMQHAWDGYRQYAFGYDEVRPQSRQGTNHWGGIGVTLVDSLDTLWIMNMHEEFQQARDWVHDTLSHDQNTKVSVFETTIRSLGGLLSAYDWSRDVVFLEEALDLARRLMRAFVHPVVGETILPFGEVNLQDGSCNMIPWAGGNAILSEFGTLQIEFRYLDEVVQTSETRGFRDKVEGIFELLHELSPDNGLFPYYMKTNHNGNKNNSKQKQQQATNKPYFSNDHLTFGAMADSFYEYMLKLWIQGGKTEPMYRTMYDKAMQGMHDELLHISSPSGLLYLADKVGSNKKRIKHKMDHLVCFVGGMLALGAYTDPLGLESERAQRDLQTAKALTYTCYQMYARMNTGISPEYVEFVAGHDFRVGPVAPHYLLRPEAVESFYILNVLTGDPIYREWGWEVFQSIEKYCKTHVAYGSIGNVQNEKSEPRDDMESFFLAETLKYLYLLHDPDSAIDILNKHVFNTEAHPMRIFPVMQEEGTEK